MSISDIRLAFVPIARTTFDIPFAEEKAALARAQLHQAGFHFAGPQALVITLESAEEAAAALSHEPVDLIVLFQATFADTTMAMKLAEASSAPVLLWAVPEPHTGGRLRLNSLCGINLAAHAFTRAGVAYQTVFAPPDAAEAVDKIAAYARACQVKRKLAQSRLGRVGEHPAGFETCEPDANALKRVFGLDLIQLDLQQDVFAPVRQLPPAVTEAQMQALTQHLTNLRELDPEATRCTLATYQILETLARQQNLDAFAIRCWPEFFTELGCAACGAMSLLNDALIPASCEADVNGALTELILQEIAQAPAFGADMVSLDAERDAVVLWHCGKAPLSMADPDMPIGATIHSNRKLPLLMEFTLKPGRVTVARLSHATGDYRLVVGRGEMVRGPQAFSGTSGYLRFDRPAAKVLDTILTEGLEHHIALTYGDHMPALRSLAEMLALPILELT